MQRFLSLLLILIVNFSYSQNKYDSTIGKPILWYTVYDPWAMFIGADGPLLTIYEKGKIIYWKDKNYFFTELSKNEIQVIISEFKLNDTFFTNSKSIQATYATDQPSYVLNTNFDTVKYFSVYGSMTGTEDRKSIPKQLRNAYNIVMQFELEEAKIWLPDKIEIMLSDYSYSPEIPIQWPNNWPIPTSPAVGSAMSTVYLDNKYYNQLIALLRKRKEKQAIEIGGKKYYVGYRLPMPNLK